MKLTDAGTVATSISFYKVCWYTAQWLQFLTEGLSHDYWTDKDKSKEDWEREEKLLQQINKLVETRDFLVDDVEFERLRWG